LLEEPEDPVRVAADADVPADRIARSVELARGGRADEDDLLVDHLGLGRPRLALHDLEVSHLEVREARADEARLRVLPLVVRLRARADERRAQPDARGLPRERVAVELVQARSREVVARARRLRRPREDEERVRTEALHR